MTQQEEAAARMSDWWAGRGPDPVHGPQQFRLHGYAGSGKTTLAKNFPAQFGLAHGEDGILYAAYTGKAAQVLMSKGCPASTLHSLIYIPQAKGRAELREMEREIAEAELSDDFRLTKAHAKKIAKRDKMAEDLSQPGFLLNEESPLRDARLLVVDECSMVDEEMAADLLGFGCRVLILGDPGQLPPVGGAGAFDLDPDCFLTEIYRQEAGDPIIDLATMARQGRPIKPGKYGDSRAYKLLSAWRYAEFDQVIVGKNATRARICAGMRKGLGRKGWKPEPEDKIIVLENNKILQVINGQQFTVTECKEADADWVTELAVTDDEGNEREIRCWSAPFRGGLDGEKKIKQTEYHTRQLNVFATWGHAITAHKSQGSQWESVLVMDESRVFRADAHRWLYTAITRASANVTIIRPA
jgi:exodeoxyribonuclease-5